MRRRKRHFVGYVLSAASSFGIVSAGLLLWQSLSVPAADQVPGELLRVEHAPDRPVRVPQASDGNGAADDVTASVASPASAEFRRPVTIDRAAEPAADEPPPQVAGETSPKPPLQSVSPASTETDPATEIPDHSPVQFESAEVAGPGTSEARVDLTSDRRSAPDAPDATSGALEGAPSPRARKTHALVRVWMPEAKHSGAAMPSYAARVFTVEPETEGRSVSRRQVRIHIASPNVHRSALLRRRSGKGRGKHTSSRPSRNSHAAPSVSADGRRIVSNCADSETAHPLYPPAANTPRPPCR